MYCVVGLCLCMFGSCGVCVFACVSMCQFLCFFVRNMCVWTLIWCLYEFVCFV